MGNGNDQINLSRDALRAELVALELRIVERITHELAAKADISHVTSLEARLVSIEMRGSPALRPFISALEGAIGRVGAVENEQLARAHLVEEHKEDHKRLTDLESWRNRFIGGGVLAIFLGAGAVARTFLGF